MFINLQRKLPKGDPRRDSLANTFEAYQNTALVLKANEQGKGERPDATIATAGLRKVLLTKILQGNMTPDEKKCMMRGGRRRTLASVNHAVACVVKRAEIVNGTLAEILHPPIKCDCSAIL